MTIFDYELVNLLLFYLLLFLITIIIKSKGSWVNMYYFHAVYKSNKMYYKV